VDWKEAKKIINSDSKVVEELKNNEIEYQIKEEIIKLRHEKKLSQADLAKLLNTRQANIARLESGRYNTSVKTLEKIAERTGKKLKIKFI